MQGIELDGGKVARNICCELYSLYCFRRFYKWMEDDCRLLALTYTNSANCLLVE